MISKVKRPVAVVRYGLLRHIAEFRSRGDAPLDADRQCVVATSRGVELGHVLTIVEREDATGRGTLLRMARPEDEARGRELRAKAVSSDLAAAREATDGIDGLKVVATERLLEGDKVIVYYTAKGRVDIPDLMRSLSKDLSLEVLFHHIGARQRARLCGGCGVCGRSLCCSTFLRTMEPVSMRMAKVQGLDLDPRVTAGACGRLKCCIRYENPLYEEHRKGLPRVGWQVSSPRISGTVVAVDVLRRKVLVRPEGGRRRAIFAAEIERAGPTPRSPLPIAGELPVTEDGDEVERGWSLLASLWRRVSPRGGREEDEEEEGS